MFASKAQMKEMGRLLRRSDFLRIQQAGRKWTARGLTVQLADHITRDDSMPRRVGFTVTKRLSKSAVVRNRAKRRLRAVAYDVLPPNARSGADYIVVGRPETLTRSYQELCGDLKWCLSKLGYLADAKEGRDDTSAA